MLCFLTLAYAARETLITDLGPHMVNLSVDNYIRIIPKPENTLAFVTIENFPTDNLTRAENPHYPDVSWPLQDIHGFIAPSGTILLVESGNFTTPVTVWILPSNLCGPTSRAFTTYQYLIVNWEFETARNGTTCYFPTRQSSSAKVEIIMRHSRTLHGKVFRIVNSSISPIIETRGRMSADIGDTPFFLQVEGVDASSVFSYRVEYSSNLPDMNCRDVPMVSMIASGDWSSNEAEFTEGIVCSSEEFMLAVTVLQWVCVTGFVLLLAFFIFWGLAKLVEKIYGWISVKCPRQRRGMYDSGSLFETGNFQRLLLETTPL